MLLSQLADVESPYGENRYHQGGVAQLKVFFAVFAAIDVSLVVWVAQNFNYPNRAVVWAANLAIAVATLTIVWLNRLAYRRIKDLEDL
jgi:hypothetical protein